MTKQEGKQMADKIIDFCINGICSNNFWDECKEIVRSIFTTACELGDYEADTNIVDKWLEEIFDCFDDWWDRDTFKKEFENYMLEYIV